MSRNLLRYKAMARAARFVDVSEYLTTEVCSACASVGGPKGTKGMTVRSVFGGSRSRCEFGPQHSPPGTSGACRRKLPPERQLGGRGRHLLALAGVSFPSVIWYTL